MGGRDKQITTYVDADLRKELETRAEKEDMSVSRYVAEVLETHVEDDLVATTSRQVEAEQRIEELVTTATDDINETTQEAVNEIITQTELMKQILLRTGIYSVGTWEILKDNVKEHRRSQAMQSASEALKPADEEVGLDINEIGAKGSYRRSDSSKRSENRNTGDEGDDSDDDEWSY